MAAMACWSCTFSSSSQGPVSPIAVLKKSTASYSTVRWSFFCTRSSRPSDLSGLFAPMDFRSRLMFSKSFSGEGYCWNSFAETVGVSRGCIWGLSGKVSGVA